MKICFIHIVDSPSQFGGAEKIALTLAKEFSKDKETEISSAVNRGLLYDELSSLGIKTYLLPDKVVFNIPSFYGILFKIAGDFRPHIVHSHHRYTTFLAHIIPFRRYKLIHTFHVEQFTKKWNRFLGDYATAVSGGCKNHFVRYFNLKDEFITVIYNGVDVNPGNITEMSFVKKDNETYISQRDTKGHENVIPAKAGIQTLSPDLIGGTIHKELDSRLRGNDVLEVFSGEIIASVIGRLTEQKGHSVLIKAISILPASVKSNLKVFFVGDGEKRSELERMVIEHDLKDCIEFVGYQKDVYPYIMASDFTILPSLWEGLPLAAIESYICGKPVIGSQVAGIPEVVIDNETGILVPSNNPERLAKAILYFMDNPALVKKFGEAGKKLALEKFTVEKMVNNYKAFYKKVLEDRK